MPDAMRSAEPCADRRMDPFVMAGQVPRIEGRAQAARAPSAAVDGLEHGVAGDADIGRLVPGDKAVEIGARRLQERRRHGRRSARRGRKGRPRSRPRSPRRRRGSTIRPPGERKPITSLLRVAGRVHDMGAQNLAGVAHDARRLQFADAEPRSGHDAPDRGRRARGPPLVQRDLIGVDRRTQPRRRDASARPWRPSTPPVAPAILLSIATR